MQNSSFQKISVVIALWIFSWLAVVGGTIYLLSPYGADQLNGFYITSTYFLFFAGLGAFYYRIDLPFNHHAPLKRQLLYVSIAVVLWSLTTLLVNHFSPLSPEMSERILSSNFYFPLFRPATLITKLCDITFQQVFILGLIKKLKSLNLSDRRVLLLFTIGFFALHLPLIFSLKLYAFYFIIPSLFAGIIFSYLILKCRFGPAFSYMVHLSFYLTVGLYLRYKLYRF